MSEEWKTYLFEYRHDGATWTVEIPARSEEDAKERIAKLQYATLLGTVHLKLPMKLGIFARLVHRWQGRRARA
jgi:hypothetical protein